MPNLAKRLKGQLRDGLLTGADDHGRARSPCGFLSSLYRLPRRVLEGARVHRMDAVGKEAVGKNAVGKDAVERRVVHLLGVSANPSGSWVTRVARNFCAELEDDGKQVRFHIRHSDTKFTASFDHVFASIGIETVLTPIRSPQAKGVASCSGYPRSIAPTVAPCAMDRHRGSHCRRAYAAARSVQCHTPRALPVLSASESSCVHVQGRGPSCWTLQDGDRFLRDVETEEDEFLLAAISCWHGRLSLRVAPYIATMHDPPSFPLTRAGRSTTICSA